MADSTNVRELAAAPPPTRRLVQPQGAKRWNRRTIRGIKPSELSSILVNAEQGDVEGWADLASFMLRDAHVRAVYETRTLSITGADLEVEPGKAGPGEEDIAVEAAAMFADELAEYSQLESLLTGLIHAEGIGWALAQHVWRRTRGEWHSTPVTIAPRDVAFDAQWSVLARTYPNPQSSVGEWIDTSTFQPGTFIAHIPTKLDRPTVSGDLMAVAWPWLFKRWCELFRQEGLEKFASPFIVGKLPPSATQTIRDDLKDALENLSADQIAVMEEGTEIVFHEIAGRAGDSWSEAINLLSKEITKGLLGSDLNVEVGSTGGNRSLGESQFDTTILPRLTAQAKRLAGTLEEQWAKPFLRLNSHRFGGRVPPSPQLRFVLVNEEIPEITQLHIDAEAVTVDELRTATGHEPWGAERGGDRIVAPVAPPAGPAFSDERAPKAEPAPPETASGGPAPRPKARPPRGAQLALPLTIRGSKTGAMSSISRTRRVMPPFPSSGGPASD